ncbi:DUF2460 domain-containing protein [Pseudomonas sp. S9]|uniref:DUF2460 domain-containing protein n=1 Tax=Pseudomonas sp. S9 TaxID=686578 RepID=UPI0002556F57|nr:DUF2460 domain-containing protein [Pseudomonas sp. S9]
MPFLNERFPENIDYGSGFATKFATTIVTVAVGEFVSRLHPFLMTSLNVDFLRQREEVLNKIIDLNMRAGGPYKGFRVKNFIDFSSNAYRVAPTPLDQAMLAVGAGVYQLVRWYGSSADPECSRRLIKKPVSGSVVVAVGGPTYPTAQYSVNYNNGLVTMAANKTRAITAISQASSATLTVGTNTFAIGDSVVVSAVSGMTQINNLRALVTAKPNSTSITIAINSSAFSTYTGGGTVQTQPINSEVVSAGFYFDIPMRFDADLGGVFTGPGVLAVSSVGLIEILNPDE